MTRVSASLLSVLAVALWPAQGRAQAGPSFNCADSDTASEVAICGNPALSQLELQMYASYLRLVDAVGERRARNIADRFLERRQACGADEACIAERLQITLRVFERRAGGDTQLAAREPTEDELIGRDAPAGEVANIEVPAPEAASPIEAPVEEEFAVVPTPPVRPERFAFLESEPEPEPSVIEDDLALAEPIPLAEEELALAAEPALPVEEPELIEEDVAASEPSEPALPIEEPALIEDDVASEPPEAALPEEEIASAEPVDQDLPLAAQAPLPSDLDPLLEEESSGAASAEPPSSIEEPSAEPAAETAAAEPAPSSEEISGAIDGAELASSTEPAPFDTPVSWAFMDLIRHQRSEIQIRLQAAGFYEGPAEGAWDRATLAGLESFLASEEGASFDASTETGAALALDFIRSDAYAELHGLPPVEPEVAADPNDPLASTDW